MSTFDSITTGVRALAETTAFRFAEDKLGNTELREAIQTVRLGANAVRIGDWDILAKSEGDDRTFDVRCKKTGDIVFTGLPFYDTARILVGELNRGSTRNGWGFRNTVRESEEYNRLRNDIDFYNERIDQYYGMGDENRAYLMEDRLSAATARISVLRSRLKCPQI